MSDYVKQIQTLKGDMANGEAELATVQLRIESLAEEQANANARLELLAVLETKLTEDAAFSDAARAKFETHDSEVRTLERERDRFSSMLGLLEVKRAGLESQIRASNASLDHLSELHLREVANSLKTSISERLRDELTTCALVHRLGSRWQSWSKAQADIAEHLLAADPLHLAQAEREAILYRVTDGLMGSPATR